MPELDRRGCTVGFQEVIDPAILSDVFVVIDARAGIGFPPPRFDGGLLAEYDAAATDRETPEMCQLPVVRAAILRSILAHRRSDDPVARRHRTQLNW